MLDSGECVTSAIPVFDGYAIASAAQQVTAGTTLPATWVWFFLACQLCVSIVSHCTACFAVQLPFGGRDITSYIERYLIENCEAELEITSLADFNVVDRIKQECCCSVRCDFIYAFILLGLAPA